MSLVVIGITGKMHVGKSTLADGICIACRPDRREEPCIRAFADKVKEIARAMGWDGKKDDKGRRLLQLIGTECGRQCIHEDIWVRLWRHALPTALVGTTQIVIADDIRFPNEADAVRSLGGVMVKVVRPGYHGDGHASETHDIQTDILIPNGGMIDELRSHGRFVLERAFAKRGGG